MSGCGSSRPVPAARRKASFQQTTWPSRPVRAGQGRAGRGQGRSALTHNTPAAWNSPAWGPRPPSKYPSRPPKKAQTTPTVVGFGVLLYCLTAKKSFAGRRHYSPRVPGGFTLPHRAVGTLGRGPRSKPRAPMQMVSGALGSLGLRV